MEVIERKSLKEITSVAVDGVMHNIGLLKDFHLDPTLNDFVPDVARLSLSWVRLSRDAELAVHEHPTKSMIVVAEGSGHTLGEISQDIRAGDIVLVPPGAQHGFVGTGPAGFWALSIQFEGDGLYKNTDSPRVAFAANKPDVASVRAENDRYMRQYQRSNLVNLISDVGPQAQDVRDRALDYLQVWSDGFQRVIAARVAAESDQPSRRLAVEHLAEEAGHNSLLAETRDGRPAQWDPVIAAVSSWFVDRMASSASIERTVLSHLVLEGSGLVFHAAGLSSFSDSRYFQLHDAADVEHLEMGYRALAASQDWTVGQISEVLREGWQMMALMCDRIAECARNGKAERHA